MIDLGHFEKNYLTICRHYKAVYDTPSIQEDPEKKKEVCYDFWYLNDFELMQNPEVYLILDLGIYKV